MFSSQILTTIVGRAAGLPIRRRAAAFEHATRSPERIQNQLRRRILHHQKHTQFAKDHHFSEIQSLSDFRRNLPIAPYEYFEPYIQKVRHGNFSALLADAKIHMFALTSGTTAARKYIPVTDQYLADYRRGWNIWGLKAYLAHPASKLRPIVQLSGDWNEFKSECGIPCGAVTGLTATMQKRLIRWLYCVPPCVGRVKDATAKYYLALRLSLYRRVGMIIAANPSTLVNLARAGDAAKESLIRDLYNGTLSPEIHVGPEIRQELAPRLSKKHPERARELEAIVSRTGTLYPKDYWSPKCLLGNWTGGSVGAYLRHYPRYFGDMAVRDVGLIASEGRMTIPMADGTPSGVLDISSHFFEFIPEEEAESSNPTALAAHEVQEGRSYFILLTTAAGLYRYNIHDLVRITGFHNRTPLVEFLSKGSHIASITGEKLSEHQVAQAMSDVLNELDQTVNAYSLAPCWDDQLPYYSLFLEEADVPLNGHAQQIVGLLDQHLCRKNEEYAAKRTSGRLGPTRLEILPKGTWHHWDRHRLARTGGSLEQYKHPCLIADPKFRESLNSAIAAARV
jgi:hypothetical protein